MKARRSFTYALTVLLALVVAAPCIAQAPSPVGRWEGILASDADPLMPEINGLAFCFRPDGTFYFPTTPGGFGHWFQKGRNAAGSGDRVRGYFYDDNVRVTSIVALELDFSSSNTLAGTMTHWLTGMVKDEPFLRVSVRKTAESCPALDTLPDAKKEAPVKPPKEPAKGERPPLTTADQSLNIYRPGDFAVFSIPRKRLW